jgi:hypothetical protein
LITLRSAHDIVNVRKSIDFFGVFGLLEMM